MAIGEYVRFQGSVAGDYVLRTGLATAVTAVMFPGGALTDGRAEAARLEFYADLGERRDVRTVFEPPPPKIPIQIRPGDGLHERGGRVERLRFHSPFDPVNPAMRRRYLRHEHNALARAQHWRHEDGPRQTLVVIHGFGASPAWFNAAFFSLRRFFTDGWDVVLFTLPFHGGRRHPRAPFNGAELFAHGFAHLCEGIFQSICDLRVVLDYVRRTGVPRVGVTGISLGGYVTALSAEVDDRLDFAIPNAAVTSMPKLIDAWFPANLGTRLLEAVKGIPRDLLARSAAAHSPLTYDPVLPRERLLVIGGRGDRMAPPEQSQWLWEHWGRPGLHWYPGSHVLHFDRRDYLDAMRGLMETPRPAPAPCAAEAGRAAPRRSRRAGR
jgi:pimeloyl-ACP methyl ester carboxylesterase